MGAAGGSSPRPKTSFAQKLALVAASLGFTYLLLEFVAFRLLLPYVPLKLHVYLDPGVRILAQSSKRSAIPRDYIAIAGDSYAQGRGDWLLSVDPDRNLDFHSAHVIHRLTGRDVITFASGGAGSLIGVVIRPIGAWSFLERSRLYALSPPDLILLYFYEGNDLYDTLFELSILSAEVAGAKAGSPERRLFQPALANRRLRDPQYFRELLETTALPTSPEYRRAQSFSLSDDLFFAKFLANTLVGEAQRLLAEAPPEEKAQPPEEWTCRARIGAREVALPRGLQEPGLMLNEAETELALYAFDQSLRYLAGFFSNSKLCVVYIPSPLASYEWISEDLSPRPGAANAPGYGPADVSKRSDEIRDRIAAAARRIGSRFVDTRPHIRAAARGEVLHGPRDWRHFNQKGYTALAEAALDCL